MHNVLITGITGFLGSHIAETLAGHNIDIIGLKRAQSDTWRCSEFLEKVRWVDLDIEGNWKKEIIKLKPTQIIHCAWIGVEAKDRDNWKSQAKNIDFLIDLIEVMNEIKLTQFVFLGSQAEYGVLEGKIKEEQTAISTNAYGSIKLAAYEILKTYCSLNKINWVWLRVFSVFGEKENSNWLIPSVIQRMKKDLEMDFTPGEQKYAYMYVKDFSTIVYQIIRHKIDSGIYNVSSNLPVALREIITKIKEKINPKFKLNFGAIPYRENQSMHLQGDVSKLTNALGSIEFTDFNVALQNTLNFYLNNSIK